jgi:hypothetical protein
MSKPHVVYYSQWVQLQRSRYTQAHGHATMLALLKDAGHQVSWQHLLETDTASTPGSAVSGPAKSPQHLKLQEALEKLDQLKKEQMDRTSMPFTYPPSYGGTPLGDDLWNMLLGPRTPSPNPGQPKPPPGTL